MKLHIANLEIYIKRRENFGFINLPSEVNQMLKNITLKALLLGNNEKNLALTIVLVLIAVSSYSMKSQGKIYGISGETGLIKETLPFVYVSKIGGMVGGFTATSNSQYISSSGLVQASKEETNGILHMLRFGHIDTSAFFNDLEKNYKSLLPKKKPSLHQKTPELSEYYAPQTLVCYLVSAQDNVACHYYGKDEIADAIRDFMNKIEKIIDKTELSMAKAGLYVRAQRIPKTELSFTTPDIKLQDLTDNQILSSILENEMALVRIDEETAKAELANKITLLPDKPIYIQISDRLYLLITYRYKGE